MSRLAANALLSVRWPKLSERFANRTLSRGRTLFELRSALPKRHYAVARP
jgi:hypothetical protein